MRRALARFFLVLSGIAIAGLIGLLALILAFVAPGPSTSPTTLVIAPGSGVNAIAGQLESQGVIADSRLFHLGVRVFGRAGRLRAGEFTFPAGASPHRAMTVLARGAAVSHALTIPEGLTSAEIVALLRDDARLAGAVGAVPAEGTLLPETYHVRRGDTRAAVLARMQAAMQAALDRLWPGRAEGLPLAGPEEAVTLASIIEKETGVAGERRLVAGVFVNRLHRGMRLQSDPTVIYAMTQGRAPLDRPLTRADIDGTDSPYNTYRIAGLPPGPIANPGLAALEAALNPAETEYLYFVADGSGGHAFARTLAEHNRNVAAWRRLRDAGSPSP
ncbi:MAG: endolytic transglycosylase MltG [Alphaproteobacteria bacterium]|jgi:UPF0755 protein|nr:endolytic transglycosylase MltG [Alphaproteobacteria bacterium]